MAELSPGKQRKTDNVHHPSTTTDDSVTHTLPQNDLGGFAGGPPGAGIDSDPHSQASILADTRIQTAQRQALALRIGERFGNQYLQKVVEQVVSDLRERGDDPGYPQKRDTAGAGSQTHPAVQRQDEEEETGPPAAVGILDGASIATYRDLYGVYDRLAKRLLEEQVKARGEGANVSGMVNRVIMAGIANRDTLAGIDASEPIDQVTFDEGYAWSEQYDKALDKIEDARISQSAANMLEANNAAASALESAQAALAKIRDAQTKAYMAEDTELGAKILGWVAKANKLTEQIITAKQEIHQAHSALANMVGQGLKCPKSTKYLYVLKSIDKVNDLYTLYTATADLFSEGKSGMAKAVKSIKSVVDIAGAAGSLIPATTGLALGFTPLQTEILNVTLKALGKLIDVARKLNKDHIEAGLYHLVNWELEPGGRPLFDYMMQVMAAGSPEEIPRPVPDAVSSYLVGNKSDIEKAASGGKEMPTEGWLWTEKVKEAAMVEWVFTHRDNLWGIFYGSAEPGSNA